MSIHVIRRAFAGAAGVVVCFGAALLASIAAAGTLPAREGAETTAAPADATAFLRGSETGGDTGAVARIVDGGLPVIAIVIDDLGADVEGTRRAILLPAPVTLSFLPYPDETPRLARAAASRGHEILVHVPMQPEGRENPGPEALLTGLAPAEIKRRLDWALGRVPGFSGINNHMGSRFTADRDALAPVMEVLSERHIFFLDSRTTAATVVVPSAHAMGVESAGRDVFLDDEESSGAVAAQLALTEHVARQQGVAIAIGHPRAATLATIDSWATHLKGFALVPVSAAIARKAGGHSLAAARD